ncbi:metal-dependent hydrolase [Endozoicomonas sp. G2_2]|uniref:metal-dependent hydrolase n=1 Tax=Endozoicomonas sp. G2_2 TaxID=2821092 RepID=UPI001ADBCA9C|nr:metal-dependent hydrolase [Endozoicomonas sp. G2_2]MBO9469777.1 metal-dependent hydrolase [Endozoicomonas sp. G2_2]
MSKNATAMNKKTRYTEREIPHSDNVTVMPERRDLHFLPPADRICDWHKEGPNVTQFMNAMSLLFPAGERMFIDAVRSYRDEIPDPDLKKAATAFIGQEAMHSREHIEYNELLENAGLPAHKLDNFTWNLLDGIKARTWKSMPLAATIALEHYTALMGDMLLRYPEMMQGSQEDFERMWRWHALEEVEHKAVAYDVYEKCIGRGPRNWAERSFAMTLATALFWPILMSFYWQMAQADENCRKQGWRGHLKLANFMFGKPGFIRKMLPEFASYFKYSFHPWQQNNADLLAEIDGLVDDAEAAYATHH